ncbi:NfeD family protein [Mariniblastus fucicola]|uniref:Uncharacterized protein n=1 Tax=Mariniblastus fucicola TaxID=980251 RepID=A0A5B9PDK4_9BACT|nr:MnhB domain-containing protein [Mariniblastus fucicola]QEG23559.1 hypothetical protein MFFC18_34600 [Mariniblastus fucicola]
MLKGAIGSLIVGLIFCFSVFLFKVLPGNQRRSAAVGLIVFGIVMMLTNIPYSWGKLNQNSSADILFVSLLLGGGFLSIAGVFLLRLNRESNEGVDGSYANTRFNPFWVVGSCIASILMVAFIFVGIVPEITKENPRQEKKKIVTVRLGEDHQQLKSPESIDEAIQNLEAGFEDKRELALEFLSNQENFAPDRRTDVCKALIQLPQQSQHTASTLSQWADPSVLHFLEQEFEKPGGYVRCEPFLAVYRELVGEEANARLVASLEGKFSPSIKSLLEKIGPDAERMVLPHMNSAYENYRECARDLLDEWNTDENKLLTQSLADTDSTEASKHARRFLTNFSGNVNEEIRNEIGKKMELAISSFDPTRANQAAIILEKFTTSSTSTTLCEYLRNSRKSHVDVRVVRILASQEDEAAEEGIIYAFYKRRGSRDECMDYLRNNGTEITAKNMLDQFDDAQMAERFEAVQLIEQMEQGVSLLTDRFVSYLESGDDEKVELGMKFLVKCKFDSDVQQNVVTALINTINSIDPATVNELQMKNLSNAAMKWANAELSSSFKKFVDSPNEKISQKAKYVMQRLKRPSRRR